MAAGEMWLGTSFQSWHVYLVEGNEKNIMLLPLSHSPSLEGDNGTLGKWVWEKVCDYALPESFHISGEDSGTGF